MRSTLAAGLLVIVAACVQVNPPSNSAASTSPSPSPDSAASATRIAPPPVTPPTAPGTNLPAFACADSGGGTTGAAGVTAVRVAEQIGYDRFVLQFDSPAPKYTVKRQAKPTFPMGASGQTITLSGTYGVLVTVTSASEANTYSGATDLTHPEFLILKEARLTQDFEGNVSWGLGLDHAVCLRSFVLTNPARLVVDFASATS